MPRGVERTGAPTARWRRTSVGLGLAALALIPFGLAAASPLLPSRAATWVIGGLAGVLALGLLPTQALLAAGIRRSGPLIAAHRLTGATILGLVIAHVVGLWLYSPDDILDALLLVAPTPFSVWGVLGLVALAAAGAVGSARSRIAPRIWKPLHLALALVAAVSAVAHAWMIEGAMEAVSKALLCLAVLASVGTAIVLTTRSRAVEKR